jgi:hypothetical protein
MKLIHIFLFLNFAATLALGQDCYLQDEIISNLEEKLSKIANHYNGEYPSSIYSWSIEPLEECWLKDERILDLEKTLIKIATKYNSEYELEFMNWEIQHWFLDPVNNTYLKRNT